MTGMRSTAATWWKSSRVSSCGRSPRLRAYVAGVFRYRGQLVPVLDLCWLMHGQPCPARLSTRIVLVHSPDENGLSHILGLMVERVTDTLTARRGDLCADWHDD